MNVYIRFIILKEHIQEESLSETSLLSTNVKGYLGVRAKKSPSKGPLLDYILIGYILIPSACT